MKPDTFSYLAGDSFRENSGRHLCYETEREEWFTYKEGAELIQLVCTKLRSSGIRKGKIVMTYTPLSLESIILCWACLYSGIVFVPVDHNWPQEMLQHITEETRPEIILTDCERIEIINPVKCNSKILITGENTGNNRCTSLFEWLTDSNVIVDKTMYDTDPSDLAVILYTSGSTGLPKGVMLSQRALFNSGKLVASNFDWNSNDVFFNLGDLHSMSGLRNTCIAPLHAGASFIIGTCEERNTAILSLERIRQSSVTFVGAAPALIRQFNILFSGTRKNHMTTLRAVLCTGGPLSRDQLELFYNNYGIPVLNYYGLTETAGICTAHNFQTFDPADNSIGHAVGADLIIVRDPEDADQKSGELVVGSENLMLGYFKKEEETQKVLIDGYFHTGDIVTKRDDGCFVLMGRKRNIVKSIYSELICLEEIDTALESCPTIMEACTCVFSRFEEDEKIIAFIVLKEDCRRDLKKSVEQLKNYLVPKVGKLRVPWCYYCEEELPRNTSGKILRPKLQEKLQEYIRTNHERYY